MFDPTIYDLRRTYICERCGWHTGIMADTHKLWAAIRDHLATCPGEGR